tara:strand:+ start:2475 stop:2855 length:381 start_codon:yes stop_codon:yes gene_type:complete
MIPEPGIHFIVKDWGINPYDPPQTYAGLNRLKRKELKRMSNFLAEIPFIEWIPLEVNFDSRENLILQIMGIVYFQKNQAFEDTEDVESFVDYYTRPTRLLNWSDHHLVDMMRKQGKFIAHIDYKKV